MNDLRDPARFDQAYRSLRPLAFSAANRVLRDRAAAEDVVQEVFTHLWRRPNAYQPARGALPGYVAMMARSRAMDRWRTRAARDAALERSVAEQRAAGPASSEDAAEPVIRREGSRRILRALDGLPAEQREALLLAYGRGLTAQEIAEAAGLPVGTVKSRVRLGLQKAREELAVAA